MFNTFGETADDVFDVPIEVKRTNSEKAINIFAGITQFLMGPILYPLFHILFNVKISGRERFKNVKDPFIIIVNHVAFYDSFFFRLALGWWTPHLPLRFMAVRKFNWKFLNFIASIGIIDFIYSLFGVFTVIPGLGMQKNLSRAQAIIQSGSNVVIYPEGQIIKSGVIAHFKNGATVLAKKTGVPVIPVSFRFGKRGLIRRKLIINIGSPISLNRHINDEEATMVLQRKVTELYERED